MALVVDTAAYATITPLLPRLADEFDLSKASAGALSASYPLGTLALSIPAGALAARVGPRRTVLAALATLAAASLVFGLAQSAGVLVVARLLQGVGAAAVWAGGLAWVVAVAPRERRVEAMGTAIGAAIAGALGGPVLGAAADSLGRVVVFLVFVALPVVLIVALARRPEPDAEARPPDLKLLADGGARTGILLMALPSTVFGAVNVLIPLHLSDLGAGAAAIAAVFLVAVAFEALMSPQAGRMADRRGALAPARLGLVTAAVGIVLLPVGGSVVTVGLAVAIATGCLGMLWAPAMSMIGDAADRRDSSPAFAFSLGNLAWGLGTAAGGAGGGALASATSDAVPYLILAAVAVITALTVRDTRRQREGDPLWRHRPDPGRGGRLDVVSPVDGPDHR